MLKRLIYLVKLSRRLHPFALAALGTRHASSRPQDILIPERLFGDPQPHSRRFLVPAHQDEIIHHPEDREVRLHHGGVVRRITVPYRVMP